MSLDYLALGTIAAIVSTVVAITALWLETKRSRLTTQADVFLRLDERFVGQEMRALRQTAARNLLKHQLHNEELSLVLDFFTNIAYMVELGALDANMAYKPFEYWVTRYWRNAHEYINDQRRFDSESWATLEKLIQDFEGKKKGTHYDLSNESLRHFLFEEAQQEETAESVAASEQKVRASDVEKHER